MPKSDWTEEGGWIDWEDLATEAGWVPPEEAEKDIERRVSDEVKELKKELTADACAAAVAAVTREFERLVALDEMPRTLGDKILRVIQNEARYGRG